MITTPTVRHLGDLVIITDPLWRIRDDKPRDWPMKRVDRNLVHARAAELRASMPEREWRR